MLSEKLTELEKEREGTGIDELIVKLDHIAYRVRMGERENYMGDLTNYERSPPSYVSEANGGGG